MIITNTIIERQIWCEEISVRTFSVQSRSRSDYHLMIILASEHVCQSIVRFQPRYILYNSPVPSLSNSWTVDSTISIDTDRWRSWSDWDWVIAIVDIARSDWVRHWCWCSCSCLNWCFENSNSIDRLFDQSNECNGPRWSSLNICNARRRWPDRHRSALVDARNRSIPIEANRRSRWCSDWRTNSSGQYNDWCSNEEDSVDRQRWHRDPPRLHWRTREEWVCSDENLFRIEWKYWSTLYRLVFDSRWNPRSANEWIVDTWSDDSGLLRWCCSNVVRVNEGSNMFEQRWVKAYWLWTAHSNSRSSWSPPGWDQPIGKSPANRHQTT